MEGRENRLRGREASSSLSSEGGGKDGDDGEHSKGSNLDATEAAVAVTTLNKLKEQLEQLQHRLESEGKKAAENAARIDVLERELANIEQTNAHEIQDHEDSVAVERQRMEELQHLIAEALRARDDIATSVSEILDGDTLKKRSNVLRMEQLVNFVLSSSTGAPDGISADDIERDVTGERVRAMAVFEGDDEPGKALRETYQRRRELWDNYEYLWLKESDVSFKPKFSSEPNHNYCTMLLPHHCRWDTCVLDRCASEYMSAKYSAWTQAVGESVTSTGLNAAYLASKAAAALMRRRSRARGSAVSPQHSDGSSTPTASATLPTPFRGVKEDQLFPHKTRV